jgi:high-affinity Fe2+/Pb2+ permease
MGKEKSFSWTKTMKRSNRIQSLVWGLFGLYLVYEGVQLKLGTPRAPKPGFMIFWMGIVILILGGVFFLQSFSAAAVGKKIRWQGVPWQRGVKVMAALFLYAAVFP